MSTRAIATASQAPAAEAATALLARGNAVDAVVAGVFAAAASSSSVLMGPVQLILGGAGLGLRAVDGRTQQPGRGVARPRGFTPTDRIPPAARVATPALPAALSAVLATSGSSTLAQVMAPAIALADGELKALLKSLSQRGPAAFSHQDNADELINAAGRIAGGVLTREDLDELRPTITTCNLHAFPTGRRAAFLPWRADAILAGASQGAGGAGGVRSSDGDTVSASQTHVVAVADAQGLLAIACYEVAHEGLDIPELGIRAPYTAAPVLRGQTRIPVGTPRPAAAPITLSEYEGVLDVALAVLGISSAERSLGELMSRLSGEALEASQPPTGGGTTLGVVRSRAGATLLRAANVGY